MKYFSGFCLKDEKSLFQEYLEDKEFVVAGFSKGAQDAIDYVLISNERIDKLQLLSPAFFDYNERLIEFNIKAFRKDKKSYIDNFLKKAGLVMENEKWKMKNKEVKVIYECSESDLKKLFTFNWEKIKHLNNIKIEIFLGECDKIISLKKAYEFFKNYGQVYYIKNVNHFLRRKIVAE